jgi:hypothetical protein
MGSEALGTSKRHHPAIFATRDKANAFLKNRPKNGSKIYG